MKSVLDSLELAKAVPKIRTNKIIKLRSGNIKFVLSKGYSQDSIFRYRENLKDIIWYYSPDY
jgi:hypothetical protein